MSKQLFGKRILHRKLLASPSISERWLNIRRSAMSTTALEELRQYSACDVSDALLALEKKLLSGPRMAGFLSDLIHLNPRAAASDPPPYTTNSTSSQMLVYPAYTVQFQPVATSLSPPAQPKAAPNIPANCQWSDIVATDSIVIVQQPAGQKNACVGGIHMLRLVKRGVKGLVVDGRVRDLSELRSLDLPVWAKGLSIVGAGAGCKATATRKPVTVCDVRIEEGDIVCIDEAEGGVVSIPKESVDGVLHWLRARGDSEDLIIEAVKQGSTVEDAFRRFR